MSHKRLPPRLDLVFKLMLTREKALLLDMLEGVLARPVLDLSIIDADIPGELVRKKSIVLDVRACLDDGSRAAVEMQNQIHRALDSRLVYYVTRDYSDQLVRGDDYGLLKPTNLVVWLNEPLISEIDRLHSIFELRERHTQVLLSDHLAIHLLQLDSLSPTHPSGYAGTVERWARFLTARDDATLDRLASEHPIMALATQTLDAISQDPETYRLAREREDALKLYRMDMAAERAGGKAEQLLKLLTIRFGPLSEATRRRIDKARGEQLDAWAEHVLTATSLDELLEVPPHALPSPRVQHRIDRQIERRIEEARREDEARTRGKTELLLELLGRRFGPLPESTRARVEAGASWELEAWVERILTAATLDEVLGR